MDAAPDSDSQRVWSMRTEFLLIRGGGGRSGSGCPDVGHLEGILTSLVRALPLIDRGILAESLAAGSPTMASLGSPTAHPYDAPFPESSSPARHEGTEPAGVKSDFVVEMSRKPALCPLPGLCGAIIHAGDPMLGDMGSERGNV